MQKFVFNDNKAAFAENLTTLIASRGITAKELADELKLPDATIYRYLHQARVPKIDNVILLAQYFGVSVDWLLGLSDSQESPWPDNIRVLVHRYTVASPEDRRVVDILLEKYDEEA